MAELYTPQNKLARTQDGQVISIFDAVKTGVSGKLSCVCCKRELRMRAVDSKHQMPHFAHMPGDSCIDYQALRNSERTDVFYKRELALTAEESENLKQRIEGLEYIYEFLGRSKGQPISDDAKDEFFTALSSLEYSDQVFVFDCGRRVSCLKNIVKEMADVINDNAISMLNERCSGFTVRNIKKSDTRLCLYGSDDILPHRVLVESAKGSQIISSSTHAGGRSTIYLNPDDFYRICSELPDICKDLDKMDVYTEKKKQLKFNRDNLLVVLNDVVPSVMDSLSFPKSAYVRQDQTYNSCDYVKVGAIYMSESIEIDPDDIFEEFSLDPYSKDIDFSSDELKEKCVSFVHDALSDYRDDFVSEEVKFEKFKKVVSHEGSYGWFDFRCNSLNYYEKDMSDENNVASAFKSFSFYRGRNPSSHIYFSVSFKPYDLRRPFSWFSDISISQYEHSFSMDDVFDESSENIKQRIAEECNVCLKRKGLPCLTSPSLESIQSMPELETLPLDSTARFSLDVVRPNNKYPADESVLGLNVGNSFYMVFLDNDDFRLSSDKKFVEIKHLTGSHNALRYDDGKRDSAVRCKLSYQDLLRMSLRMYHSDTTKNLETMEQNLVSCVNDLNESQQSVKSDLVLPRREQSQETFKDCGYSLQSMLDDDWSCIMAQVGRNSGDAGE